MVRRFAHWLEQSRTIALTIAVLFVLTLSASIAVPFFAYSKVHCIAHWADEYTARAQLITKANDDRVARLSDLAAAQGKLNDARQAVFDATSNMPFDREKFLAALTSETTAYREFDAAQKAYAVANATANQTAANNPIPDPPKLRC